MIKLRIFPSIYWCISIALVLGCSQGKDEIDTTSSARLAIDSLINEWHNAASEANFDRYFDCMLPSAVFIGTDATENWRKDEFMLFSKPYFDAGKAWDFHVVERNSYFNRKLDVCWFDELLETWMGICRGSGVLEKTQDGWKINHYVLSVSIPNEVIHEVIDIKAKEDGPFRPNIHN